MSEKKNKTGRNPKHDPAVFRYTVRFNREEHDHFLTMYNPQNEMFRLLGTKRSFSQNETFFFSHPYPALFRLISHF